MIYMLSKDIPNFYNEEENFYLTKNFYKIVEQENDECWPWGTYGAFFKNSLFEVHVNTNPAYLKIILELYNFLLKKDLFHRKNEIPFDEDSFRNFIKDSILKKYYGKYFELSLSLREGFIDFFLLRKGKPKAFISIVLPTSNSLDPEKFAEIIKEFIDGIYIPYIKKLLKKKKEDFL